MTCNYVLASLIYQSVDTYLTHMTLLNTCMSILSVSALNLGRDDTPNSLVSQYLGANSICIDSTYIVI